MKDRGALKLYNCITNIDDEYIQEAQAAGRRKRSVLTGWGMAAACLCLICILAVTTRDVWREEPMSDIGLNVTPDVGEAAPNIGLNAIPNVGTALIADIGQAGGEQEIFVPITSLLADGNDGEGIRNLALALAKIPMEQYTGIYESVPAADSAVLSASRGRSVSGAEGWYYVSGHRDMQYLIRNVNEEYTLWKFSCFDSEKYPYSDVLTLVYQIDSADVIREIVVRPATMDNTDGGKALQEKIGIYSITDREEIDTVYQILTSLTCYGRGHWEMIDYGGTDMPADREVLSHQAVWLGRYLSIITDYGNEIDGLKYTAVSDMFYEYSGIAYDPLTSEQAERICEILKIGESSEEPQYNDAGENAGRSEDMSVPEAGGNILAAAGNTGASLEYITELQNKVSTAMMNGELPFVIVSAVYEDPYRLHLVVTTDSESDIEKLKEFDTLGDTMEIEYVSGNNNNFFQ